MAAAIGDVHGRSDLLEEMLAGIAADVRETGPDLVDCVMLGDLIDRGPDSRGCLGLAAAGLAAHRPGPPVRDVVLLGNHDDWLKKALDGTLTDDDARVWASNGGIATWGNLGVTGVVTDGPALAEALREAVPEELQAVVRGMALSHRVGDIVFVHAGLDPRVALEAQPRESLLWIRGAFLDAPERSPGGWPFEVIVVHGHTIEGATGEPRVHPHRIGIDTGAVQSGVLTAVEFLGDRMRFVQVEA